MIPSRLATDLDLVLDPAIRNWGVLPIVVFVLCINLLKSYAMVSTLVDRVLSSVAPAWLTLPLSVCSTWRGPTSCQRRTSSVRSKEPRPPL